MTDIYERIERLEQLQESNAIELQKLALLVSDVASICKRDIEDVQALRVIDTIDVLLRVSEEHDQKERLSVLRESLVKELHTSPMLNEEYLEREGWQADAGVYTHSDTSLCLTRRDDRWVAYAEVYDIGELYTCEQHHSMCKALGIGCSNKPGEVE